MSIGNSALCPRRASSVKRATMKRVSDLTGKPHIESQMDEADRSRHTAGASRSDARSARRTNALPLERSRSHSASRARAAIAYDQFRTGLTFRDVYYMLWERNRKRRHTVLGKWREIKLAMYEQYLHES